jgi:hypothetical protein
MPREGAIIFSDLIGKLDVLRVSCSKCERDGCYGLNRLITQRATRTIRAGRSVRSCRKYYRSLNSDAAVGYLAAALSGPSFHSLMLSDMTLIAVTAEWLRLA